MIQQRGNPKTEDVYAKSYVTEREVSDANDSFSSKPNEARNSDNGKLDRLAVSFLEILGNINSSQFNRQRQSETHETSQAEDSVETQKRSSVEEETVC